MGRAVAKRLSLRIEMIQKRRKPSPPGRHPAPTRTLGEAVCPAGPVNRGSPPRDCDVFHIEIVREELKTFQEGVPRVTHERNWLEHFSFNDIPALLITNRESGDLGQCVRRPVADLVPTEV